jgi:hypothetical protein
MSLKDFLKPPMFPPPESIYLPLADFPAGDPVKMRADVDNAIAQLNQKAKDFSSSAAFTKKHIEFISDAEAHAVPKEWAEAHETIWEATFALNRALESSAAAKFRKWMGVYYACWLLVLVVVGSWLKQWEATDDAAAFVGAGYWRYGLMGALGGLTIALWGLILHSVGLDFDRSFVVWYWLKPVLGAIMGLVAVLTVLAGLFALEAKPELNSKMALYVLAFLAGFSERFFVRILDRVMTSFLGGDPAVSTSSPPARPRGKAKARTPAPNEEQ